MKYYQGLILAVFTALLFVTGGEKPVNAEHRNIVLFIADGMRHAMVNEKNAPNLFYFSRAGVSFPNSHSVYPTLTMVNASVIATGHLESDTGVFGNDLFAGFPLKSAAQSSIPFLENDAVLTELNDHFENDFLSGQTLLSAAAQAGYNVAAVGKLGPAFLQLLPRAKNEPIVFDDVTGNNSAITLPGSIRDALTKAGLPLATPPRGENGAGGNLRTPGTTVANLIQQNYFIKVATDVLLPYFKSAEKPFLMLYWSRDPDGTQHNQGDSLNKLIPGINGPTTLAAIKNADANFGQLLATLKKLGLDRDTDVLVTSDHGFSTISRESATSFAAQKNYADTPAGQLPPGFLAIDLAQALDLKLFDPDKRYQPVDPDKGQHPSNAYLGKSEAESEIIVAANGGSDTIYLLGNARNHEYAEKIVQHLLSQDYTGAIFVHDDLGSIPGTLKLSTIGLTGGSHRTPVPAIFVSFKTFSTGCAIPTNCGVVVSDTTLQQGQGMHGSFGRQDTFNFTAAGGPDFKRAYADLAPVSNADLANTVAHLLGITIKHAGPHLGRSLNEIFVGAPEVISTRAELFSTPYRGLVTKLKFQTVGTKKYFDAAGIPGRTLGLD
jgi:hypothetical protein